MTEVTNETQGANYAFLYVEMHGQAIASIKAYP
jgi:hypothetical protein